MTFGKKSMILALTPVALLCTQPRLSVAAEAQRVGQGQRITGEYSKSVLPTLPRQGNSNVSQEQERKPLGSLTSVGEVYVNGMLAPREATIFEGDALRTGDAGTADFTASGLGSLKISSMTQLTFEANQQYLAELNQGSVVMSGLGEASKFQIRLGRFAVFPGPEAAETIAQIERSPDNSFRIVCNMGNLGIIALEGTEALFLQAGQSATISPEGALRAANLSPTAGQTVSSAQKSKSKKGWIILGAAGGGGAVAAAVVLGTRGKASPSSP